MPASASAEHEKTPPEKGRGSCTTPAAMYQKTDRILLPNPLQDSKSTFSRGSFLSFFAFKEGILIPKFRHLGLANSIPPFSKTPARKTHCNSYFYHKQAKNNGRLS